MVQRPQRHLSSYLLTQRYQGNAGNSCRLVESLGLLQMLGAAMQHLLHVQHVSGVGKGKAFYSELRELSDWVRDGIQGSQGRLDSILLPQVEEPKAHSKEVWPGPAQCSFYCLSLEEGLQNRLCYNVVAGGNENQTQAHGGHGRALNGAGSINYCWSEVLQQILPAGASIGMTQAHNGRQPEHRIFRFQLLTKECPCRVALILHSRGYKAEG
mmetsp:Transcript_69619/g.167051  ORF Transcript_69619/g.167051 Transcript_69619/m.167051 type:complete len:212 (-) Transcript_69619:1406-2041(-)